MARNSRIIIRDRTTGDDALGQPLTTWVDRLTLWGEIRHLSGLAAIKADANVGTVRASIKLRKRTDVHAGMRAVHGSTVYEIKAVLPDEQNRLDMYLVCEVEQ